MNDLRDEGGNLGETSSDDERARFLGALVRFEVEGQALLAETKHALPVAGYAVPMAAQLMEARANRAVDHVAPWGSADFSAMYRNLVDAFADFLSDVKDQSSFSPFFLHAHGDDPAIDRYLQVQHILLVAMNERVSVAGGLLYVTWRDNRFCLSIADSRRRSALTLLRDKALYLSHSETERALLSGSANRGEGEKDVVDLATLTLTMNLHGVDVLRKGLPDVWKAMLVKLGFSEEALLTFLAFLSVLPHVADRWLSAGGIRDWLGQFCGSYKRPAIGAAEFEALLDLFASDVETARRIGTATPFVRIRDWYRIWPFCYHVVLPELVFVTLVQAKRRKDWADTFGGSLARAADYLKHELVPFDGITVIARREKKGIGDIDLAVFDRSTGSLLICEIKTVFDRFRTEFQAANFTDDRVNFAKAVAQLDRTRDALSDGSWPLRDLFGKSAPAAPTSVHRLVLLWRDHANPTLDGADFVPACDFTTFLYLFARCEGQPGRIARCIEELEKLFWVSSYRDDFWPIGNEQIAYSRENETDILPPLSFIDGLDLDPVVREEVGTLKHLPSDWQTQAEATRDDPTLIFNCANSPSRPK